MTRIAQHTIDRLFIARHSPRALSGAPLPREELRRLLEAARFAPSASNLQPWRFVVAELGSESFDAVLGCLAEGNQGWAKRAAAFVVVSHETTRVTSEGKTVPMTTAAFDTGAAWMALALQGHQQGVVIHAMAGFDHDAIRAPLKMPDDIAVVAVVAVGLLGDPTLLLDWQQKAETPNTRKPLEETVFFGAFPAAKA